MTPAARATDMNAAPLEPNAENRPRRGARRRGSELSPSLMQAALAVGGGGGGGRMAPAGPSKGSFPLPGKEARLDASERSGGSAGKGRPAQPFLVRRKISSGSSVKSQARAKPAQFGDDRSCSASSMTSLSSMGSLGSLFDDEETFAEFRLELEASKLKTGTGVQELLGKFLATKRQQLKEEELRQASEMTSAATSLFVDEEGLQKQGPGTQGLSLPSSLAAMRKRTSHGASFLKKRASSGPDVTEGAQDAGEALWNGLDGSHRQESYENVIRGDTASMRGDATPGTKALAASDGGADGTETDNGHQGSNILGLFRWGGHASGVASVRSDGSLRSRQSRADRNETVPGQSGHARQGGGLRKAESEGGAEGLARRRRERADAPVFNWFGLGGDRRTREEERDNLSRAVNDKKRDREEGQRRQLLQDLMSADASTSARDVIVPTIQDESSAVAQGAARPRTSRPVRSCLKKTSAVGTSPPNPLASLARDSSAQEFGHAGATMHLLRLLLDMDGSLSNERAGTLRSSGNSQSSAHSDPVNGRQERRALDEGKGDQEDAQAGNALLRRGVSADSLLTPLPNATFRYRPRRKHSRPSAGRSNTSVTSQDVQKSARTLDQGGGGLTNDGDLSRQVANMASTGSLRDVRKRHVPVMNTEEARNEEWPTAPPANSSSRHPSMTSTASTVLPNMSVVSTGSSHDMRRRNVPKVGMRPGISAASSSTSLQPLMNTMASTGSSLDMRRRRIPKVGEDSLKNQDWGSAETEPGVSNAAVQPGTAAASSSSSLQPVISMASTGSSLDRRRRRVPKVGENSRKNQDWGSLGAAAEASNAAVLSSGTFVAHAAPLQPPAEAVPSRSGRGRNVFLDQQGAGSPIRQDWLEVPLAADSVGLRKQQLQRGESHRAIRADESNANPLPHLMVSVTNEAVESARPRQVQMTPLPNGGGRGASSNDAQSSKNLFQRYLESKARGMAACTPASSMDVRFSNEGNATPATSSAGELLVNWGDTGSFEDEEKHGKEETLGEAVGAHVVDDLIITVDHDEAAQRRVSDITTAAEDQYLTIKCNTASMRRFSDLTTGMDSDEELSDGDGEEEEETAPAAFKRRMRSLAIKEEEDAEGEEKDDLQQAPTSSYLQRISDDEAGAQSNEDGGREEQVEEFFFYFDEDEGDGIAAPNGLQQRRRSKEDGSGDDVTSSFTMGAELIRNMSQETLREENEAESEEEGSNK